jgi:hypothetical protein
MCLAIHEMQKLAKRLTSHRVPYTNLVTVTVLKLHGTAQHYSNPCLPNRVTAAECDPRTHGLAVCVLQVVEVTKLPPTGMPTGSYFVCSQGMNQEVRAAAAAAATATLQ